MRITESINISDNRLVNGLIPAIRMMSKIEGSDPGSDVRIDFSKAEFLSPVFVLSLLVYLKSCGRKVIMENRSEYMKIIHMDDPLKPDLLRSTEFSALMQGYSSKTYIPVISFPALSRTDEKEQIMTSVENLIVRQSSIPNNVVTGLKYMINETIDNITEHSHSERGYVFAQAYPEKGHLDICIADDGITLLGSYQNLENNEIADDLEAIRAANSCISSKNYPDAENRGYGIYTSKKMLVNGLCGQYMMMSGSAVYMKGPKFEQYLTLWRDMRWKGTIVAFRMPYNVPDFNYIDYIE